MGQRQGDTEMQYQQRLVTDRCIIAIHDYATREGANKTNVIKALKADGFTSFDISEAIRRTT